MFGVVNDGFEMAQVNVFEPAAIVAPFSRIVDWPDIKKLVKLAVKNG